MFGQNRFLHDFMKSQTKLITSTVPEATVKKDKKGRTKSKHGTASGKPAFEGDAFSLLVSEKPHKKEVLEYFRNRVTELIAEDLDNTK